MFKKCIKSLSFKSSYPMSPLLECSKSINPPRGLTDNLRYIIFISFIPESPFICIFQSSLQPGLSFRGGRFSLEESRGTKSDSLLHTTCYHNQMYKVYAKKSEFSCMLQIPRLILYTDLQIDFSHILIYFISCTFHCCTTTTLSFNRCCPSKRCI